MSQIEKITDTINASLAKFKAELLQQQEKSEPPLSSKLQQNIPDFKKKGNMKQFEFNIKVQDLQKSPEGQSPESIQLQIFSQPFLGYHGHIT